MDIDKKYILLSKDSFESQKRFILCAYCDKIMIDPVRCKLCNAFYCSKCLIDLPNRKVSLFFSSLFSVKDTKCLHEQSEPSNDCMRVINALPFSCKNNCGMVLDLKEFSDHLEFKCPKYGLQAKIEDTSKRIDNLEQSNSELKMNKKVLLNQYYTLLKQANPWIKDVNDVHYNRHMHSLSLSANGNRDWACGICKVKHQRNQKSFHCGQCTFDLCFECVIDELFI